jgi:putative hydrolase of the HAD superfamily
LVAVNWSVAGFAKDCAGHVGLDLPDAAFADYQGLYYSRLPEFRQINRTRDSQQGARFWDRLTQDWLRGLGADESWTMPIRTAAEELGFGPSSILFRLYEDVLPCLEQLDDLGVRCAVVSNWDYSLHRVLDMLGVQSRFEVVLASLEEGVEKPDPRLFHIALDQMGVDPADALHVGDLPEDDFAGATAAGMRAVLIDRNRTQSGEGVIRTLTDLPEAFSWSA